MGQNRDGSKGNGQTGMHVRLADFDHVLRTGLKHGPAGRRAAIKELCARIPGVTPGQCWKRLRQLREGGNGQGPTSSIWTPEITQVLEEGYRLGGRKKTEAINQILQMCPGLKRHSVSKYARRQSWGGYSKEHGRFGRRSAWNELQRKELFHLAGCEPAKKIAQRLQHTEAAVRWQLRALGLAARVKDGYSLRSLQKTLHLGLDRLHRYVATESLRVRDPRISSESLGAFLADHEAEFGPGVREQGSALLLSGSDGYSGTKVARLLGVEVSRVAELIGSGALRVLDSSVTERAFQSFLRKHGAELNFELIDSDTRKWLADEYGVGVKSAPSNGSIERFQKHALKLRACPKCGREMRGNAYFVHFAACGKKKAGQMEEVALADDRSDAFDAA